MRLIDADAFKKWLLENSINEREEKESRQIGIWIDAFPTAEPRKKGKWIIKTINTFELAYGSTGYEPVYECSLCGGVEESYLRLDEPIMPMDADFPKFCPNCGADMRGGQE